MLDVILLIAVYLAHRPLRRAITFGGEAARRRARLTVLFVRRRRAEARRMAPMQWVQLGSVALVTVGGTYLQPRAEDTVAVGGAAMVGLAMGAALVITLERFGRGRSRPA
jgi:hypothetical protein